MSDVVLKIVRVTDPSVVIPNAADYEYLVPAGLVPQIGDWIRFSSGRHKVETRTWDYSGETPACSLGIDFVGQRL